MANFNICICRIGIWTKLAIWLAKCVQQPDRRENVLGKWERTGERKETGRNMKGG